MFKNEYQGGAFVEIFSAQGKNPGAKWKILGSPSVIWKEFDKEVKSFVFVLKGSSQTNKIQLPKENKQILGLIQRFLVLQIYIPLGQDFSTELLITDLRNIKRRLYLSTVHKELSSTPLHAKIPLFMIKRKIWCNLCIDLVAFTSEIFKGAVFQSLDGIIVSANCKLRKIFTLKCRPQDTADKDDEPTDIIPRSCQLTTDVPQVTQLLNMTKLRQTEIKFGGHTLSSAESGNSSGNNRNEHKATTVLTTVSQQRTETLNPSSPAPQSPDQADEWIFPENDVHNPHLASSMQSLLLDENSCNTSHLWLEASKKNEHDQQTEETQIVPKGIFTFSSRPRSAPHGKTQNMSPEGCPFILDLKEDTSVTRRDTQLEDDFYGGDSTEEGNHRVQGSTGPTTSPPRLTQLTLESVLGKTARWTNKGYLKNSYTEAGASENQNSLAKQIDKKDFETSLVPIPCLSPPGRRSESSPKIPGPVIKAKDLPTHQVSSSIYDISLQEISGEKLKPIPEVSEYDWRNYQPSQMSESELQMLASLRRQQNEELEDTGASHGLSTSQVDNCNVSISTSSDDTTTWNSCLPPPVNQGHHYQKELNPPSPSNPRDWLNMLNPPTVPPSQQPAEQHQDSSGSLSARGGEDLSVEEDEEVLTLLYDPCLNCYFDPQTGKYYELV
ncbi:protein CFAP20DC isoform X6 [Mesoplodon densirostris]|uniref:protein CFAP20DC isoform X6 n=1 Tax=Mesoplodon densirostris TaxID=48708 RepID=UPI0028DC56D2|nr:protein CFAP20DC isoform X6 [Mesoplodon densirostris]